MEESKDNIQSIHAHACIAAYLSSHLSVSIGGRNASIHQLLERKREKERKRRPSYCTKEYTQCVLVVLTVNRTNYNSALTDSTGYRTSFAVAQTVE
jgi:hypothetical protein